MMGMSKGRFASARAHLESGEHCRQMVLQVLPHGHCSGERPRACLLPPYQGQLGVFGGNGEGRRDPQQYLTISSSGVIWEDKGDKPCHLVTAVSLFSLQPSLPSPCASV